MFDVGIDIEDIERFEKYKSKEDSFIKKVFSKNEIEYCFSYKNPKMHLAARFCAKEAFIKCVSELKIPYKMNEIEVLNKENGKPYLNLDKSFKDYNFSLSLSHDRTKAIAIVICKKISR